MPAIHANFERLAEPRIVIVDTERVPAQDGDVIPLAWVNLAVEACGKTVFFRKTVQPRRFRPADDLIEAPVFRDDDEDMLVAGHGSCRSAKCRTAGCKGEKART